MKRCLKLIAIALGVGLAGMTAHAMSELTAISVTPLWPTNSNPGNTMFYEVRIERQGEGMLEVDLTSGGLPAGCQVSFTPNPVRFTGNEPQYQTALMTVTACKPVSPDACAFTITATARRETITWTNTPCAPMNGAAGSLLVRLTPCAGGAMEVRGLGCSCQCLRIESTTDLTHPNWTAAGSCTADGNGRFIFLHDQAQAGGCMRRFYRAVSVAPGN